MTAASPPCPLDHVSKPLSLGAIPTSPSTARTAARSLLAEWGLNSLADTVELLVSELMTNAIQVSSWHQVPPPVQFRMSAAHGLVAGPSAAIRTMAAQAAGAWRGIPVRPRTSRRHCPARLPRCGAAVLSSDGSRFRAGTGRAAGSDSGQTEGGEERGEGRGKIAGRQSGVGELSTAPPNSYSSSLDFPVSCFPLPGPRPSSRAVALLP